jgi:hypothetical protein
MFEFEPRVPQEKVLFIQIYQSTYSRSFIDASQYTNISAKGLKASDQHAESCQYPKPPGAST